MREHIIGCNVEFWILHIEQDLLRRFHEHDVAARSPRLFLGQTDLVEVLLYGHDFSIATAGVTVAVEGQPSQLHVPFLVDLDWYHRPALDRVVQLVGIEIRIVGGKKAQLVGVKKAAADEFASVLVKSIRSVPPAKEIV